METSKEIRQKIQQKIQIATAELRRQLSVAQVNELQVEQVKLPRKVIYIGAGSYCITLPKIWCHAHGLKGRDEVYVQFDPSGILKIYPPNNKQDPGDAKPET